jgi:hypothetical protein
LQTLLKRALTNTAALWPALEIASKWVYQATDILSNDHKQDATEVCKRLDELLTTIQEQREKIAPLRKLAEHFVKVTANYAPGLFYTYDIPDVPRTHNDLEQCFGSVRWHERRATGRKGAVPGLVVRGPVRVLAAVTAKRQCFLVRSLQLRNPQALRELRDQLSYREENRRMQFRFRKNPSAYLAALQVKLLKAGLPT